ncbi:hypothetical protein N7G274_004345 [Stereocaulon virgatum]|uniref:Uncharacterized protein n=1 Tax=Stereocaulon virgatum TaxID=373712 RepID=A0ABR4ACK2_9LECA
MQTSIYPLLFLAATALSFQSSLHPNEARPVTYDLNSSKCTPCICLPSTLIQLKPHHPKRNHGKDIQSSPNLLPASHPSSGNTSSTTTQSPPSTKPFTFDTIITATFRAVITILSLLNVNITWRLHAHHAGHRLRLARDNIHPGRHE